MPARPPLSLQPVEPRLAPAVIGAIDPTFGYDGRNNLVQTGSIFFPGQPADDQSLTTSATTTLLSVQPDGRLLALAPSGNDPSRLALSQTLANGRPDPAFGYFGQTTVSFDDPAAAGVVRPVGVIGGADGRATVVTAIGPAGGSPTRLGLLRYNPLGRLDVGFGDGSQRRIDLPSGYTSTFAGARAVKSPGGGIVVAVPLTPTGSVAEAVGVLRLTADGVAEAGGWRVVPYPLPFLGSAAVGGVAVAADGGVLVGLTVSSGVGDGTDLGVLRITTDGQPDAAFGPGGIASAGFDAAGGIGDATVDVAALPDGRVLVVGAAAGGANGTADFGVVRLTARGQADATFGPDGTGRVRVAFDRGGSADDRATAVAVQADGRVVVAGTVAVAPAQQPGVSPDRSGRTAAGVVRLTAAGAVDPSFGPGGRRVVPTTPDYFYSYPGYYTYSSGSYTSERASAVALQPGGRVVVGLNSVAVTYSTYYDPDTGNLSVYGSAYASLVLAGLTGRVGPPLGLAVGGVSGAAVRLDPGADGTYRATATDAPFGGQPGSVRAARADFDGDGVEDAAYASPPGGPPEVRLVSGRTGDEMTPPFQPFEATFTGGLFVAAADLDGDGRAELVVSPDRGGGPRVRMYALVNGLPVSRADFYGIDDPDFRGGARTALGDVNGDGTPDLIVGAGFGGGPRVALFDGRALLFGAASRLAGDFLAFPGGDAARLRDGVYVAAGDLTGDGVAEVVVGAGPGGGPRVLALDSPLLLAGRADAALANPVANLFTGDPAARGGVRVAVRDADGDGTADLVTGSGAGQAAAVRVYRSAASRTAAAPDQTLSVFGGGTLADGVYVG